MHLLLELPVALPYHSHHPVFFTRLFAFGCIVGIEAAKRAPQSTRLRHFCSDTNRCSSGYTMTKRHNDRAEHDRFEKGIAACGTRWRLPFPRCNGLEPTQTNCCSLLKRRKALLLLSEVARGLTGRPTNRVNTQLLFSYPRAVQL